MVARELFPDRVKSRKTRRFIKSSVRRGYRMVNEWGRRGDPWGSEKAVPMGNFGSLVDF